MKVIILALLCLCIVGCAKDPTVDQRVRAEQFHACLASLPAGPVQTKYNDWAEIISECSSYAYYVALQDENLIPIKAIPDNPKAFPESRVDNQSDNLTPRVVEYTRTHNKYGGYIPACGDKPGLVGDDC